MGPCYKIATPDKEGREGRSFSPDEFVMSVSAHCWRSGDATGLLEAVLFAVPR